MLLSAGVVFFSLFVLFTIIQLSYYGYFFLRLASYKPPADNSTALHAVSVIVCARDEQAALTQNLPSVLQQQYSHRHEVIVVNDNSFDGSAVVLEEAQQECKHLTVISLTQEAKHIAGKKYPLSIGIKEAKNEVLLLTDADCQPASTDWLHTMQAGFAPGIDIVLGYGAYTKLPGLLNKLIRFETFHAALQYLSYALAGQPYMGVGRNLAYRRELFFKHKGFASINHIASGDDDLFINKAATLTNTAIVIDKSAFTFSEPKTTWRAWRRQKSRHYSTGKYYKPSHQALLGLYAASGFFFYPAFVTSVLFFDWRYTLLPLGLKLIIQGIICYKAMKKLGEEDLFPYFILFDLWQFFYYFIFAASLWKQPRKKWD